MINELEGLSRGGKSNNVKLSPNTPLSPKLDIFTSPNAVKSNNNECSGKLYDAEHAIKVAEASKRALDFVRSTNSTVKWVSIFYFVYYITLKLLFWIFRCVTTKGSVLKTSKFTVEDDSTEMIKNDDKILTTALNLCDLNSDKKTGNKIY